VRSGKLVVGVVIALLVAAPTAAASGWLVQPVPTPRGATGAILTAVTCTGPHACIGVGSYDTKAGSTGVLAERWNGRQWSVMPAAPVPRGAAWISLLGVSCASDGTCIGVGNQQRGGSFTLAESWSGTRWSVQRTPTPAFSDSALEAVSCTSSRFCLAISDGVDERWNGHAWSYVDMLPMPSWADVVTVGGISCTASSWCMAVGQASWEGEDPSQQHAPWAVAWRWNGRHWSLQTFRDLDHLSDVSCATDAACMAVGGGAAERWNGTGWSRVPVPGHGGLASVSCVSPLDCTAVGTSGSSALAERWNGARWSVGPTPALRRGYGGHLDGLSCTSAQWCTAVGGYTGRSGRDAPLAEVWTP
jgi:hypothetical protein